MNNQGNNLLWYREGARSWNEALPIGNGRIGGMVYGGAVTERISLNEDTLWSGTPSHCENPEAAAAYREARELALQRDAAAALIGRLFGNRILRHIDDGRNHFRKLLRQYFIIH